MDNYNGQYEFSSAYSKYNNGIADFYQMKNVQIITIVGSEDTLNDEEKLNKFSELHNLKEIYFANLSEADLKQFYIKMKSILPQCKIFAGEDKVEITD